jgi:hypothetical protein
MSKYKALRKECRRHVREQPPKSVTYTEEIKKRKDGVR